MVLLEGRPVKACMTKVRDGASIRPADGLPDISALTDTPLSAPLDPPQKIIDIPVLIIGGGPAGLSAALELGQLGVKSILVDDKSSLGGKLVLQTHRFFGSTSAVHAGTRGIDIARKLAGELEEQPSVQVWLDTTAIAIYEDQVVGLWNTQKIDT